MDVHRDAQKMKTEPSTDVALHQDQLMCGRIVSYVWQQWHARTNTGFPDYLTLLTIHFAPFYQRQCTPAPDWGANSGTVQCVTQGNAVKPWVLYSIAYSTLLFMKRYIVHYYSVWILWTIRGYLKLSCSNMRCCQMRDWRKVWNLTGANVSGSRLFPRLTSKRACR